MENLVVFIINGLTGLLMLRLIWIPMQLIFRLLIHSGCGFLCLWLLNTASAFTGILFPVNAVTVLTAGFLGVPGMAVMALLQMMA